MVGVLGLNVNNIYRCIIVHVKYFLPREIILLYKYNKYLFLLYSLC